MLVLQRVSTTLRQVPPEFSEFFMRVNRLVDPESTGKLRWFGNAENNALRVQSKGNIKHGLMLWQTRCPCCSAPGRAFTFPTSI
jgi:hypothetical protein